MAGKLAFPCLWTDCGCLADGDNLLECPDMARTCAQPTPEPPSPPGSACEGFCQKENLSLRFLNWTIYPAAGATYCYFYKHHSDLCGLSYVQDGSHLIPCMWSPEKKCVANRDAAVDCERFNCAEQTALVERRLVGEGHAHAHKVATEINKGNLRGGQLRGGESLQQFSVSGPILLDLGSSRKKAVYAVEEEPDESAASFQRHRRAVEL